MNSKSQNSALGNFNSATYLKNGPGQTQAQAAGGTKTRTYKYSDFGKGFCTWLVMNGNKTPGTHNFEDLFGFYKLWVQDLLHTQFKAQPFTFGKYKGHTIAHVLLEDEDYCKWVAFEVQGTQRAEARMLEKWFWCTGQAPRREVRVKPASENHFTKWTNMKAIPI